MYWFGRVSPERAELAPWNLRTEHNAERYADLAHDQPAPTLYDADDLPARSSW